MRILVCNDDGFEAPGLRLLAAAATAIDVDVWTIAPERKWTAASHQLTFDRDLTLTRIGERSHSCSGAPADCVVAAMTVLFADDVKPALVLAGVNDRRNVGEDIAYSGTMAIAREATFWGVTAIAVSRAAPPADVDATLGALRRTLDVLWRARAQWAAEGHWLSINLPAAMPARLAQARIARDKIGGASEIVARSAKRIVYRLRRGRPGHAIAGDENALLDSGQISMVRHCWNSHTPLPDEVVATWNDLIV